MKSIRPYKTIHFYFLIALVFSFITIGCEGLDDWSDLKNIDLFDSKNGEDSADSFKHYTEPVMSSQPLVVFLVDETSKSSKFYSKEIQKACDYTKIPYNKIGIDSWNHSLKIAPATRVICLYDSQKLSDASIPKLIDFVANGGTLYMPFANVDKKMGYLLGLKTNAEFATDTKSMGWHFSVPMLPNFKGKNYSLATKFYGLAPDNFSKKVKILATAASNSNYPLIVENTIGKGHVLLYNNSGDFGKADRGLLFAGILKGIEGIPYPIANTSTIFLDDFPSPQYDVRVEPVASELNMTMSKFVEKVWWPDLKKLSKEFNIPYAAMTTFDYRNKIVPPFTLDQWNTQKTTVNNKTEPITDWLVKDVAKSGSEVAFHGYNHVSLMNKLWKNKNFITTSMNSVKKKWEISNFGKMPTTYVPPSNDIDRMGIVELKKAMPSLKYMCSLYLGLTEDGGNREFDYDPYNKEFFDYPRISSGFYLSDDRKYNVQSMYLMTGIWTHFVHPDDIFQIPLKDTKPDELGDLRNGEELGWYKTKGKSKGMYSEFRNILKQMTSTYPQLRFLSANDAAKIVIDWRASRYTHKTEKGLYTVKQNNSEETGKKYWFMYGSTNNSDRIETQLKNQQVLFSKAPFMDGYLYSVYTDKPKLTVIDLNYESPKERAQQVAINQLVRADFAAYKEEAWKFQTGAIWADDSDKKLKMEMAALKNKMLTNATIDSVTWNKYAKYLSWENRAGEVWKMYEDHVTKYASKENILYSKELDRMIGYKNDDAKEKWMIAQIAVSPNDKELLNSYVTNFNTEDNKEKIKIILKKLTKIDPSPQSYANYIKHLLQYYPEEARTELSDKEPTKDLSEFATQIVWLFADNADYKKAIEWSNLSKDIDFVTKMSWYIESGQSKALEKEYLEYIATHPEDYKAKALMSSVYHELGRFKDSWVLADSLPENAEKENLRKTLNKDVVYEATPLQEDLIANHAALFYPNVLQSLIKENRLTKGNFVDLLSSLETNQAKASIQKNVLTYNFYDSKRNLHGVSATYTKYYKLKYAQKFDENFDNTLMGVQYKYTTAQKDGKPNYWSRARIEVDKKTNPYYQFGAGISTSKEKRYRSAEFNLFPVETAPGLNQKMYHLQLNLYQDFYLFKYINTSISFEGSYYTDGLLSRDTIYTGPVINPNRLAREIYTQLDSDTYEVATYNNALQGALTIRTMLNNGEIKKSKFIPFLEGQYSMASRELAIGYPYWMIKNRLYGGGGLGWEFGVTDFHSRIEGGFFLDDYSKNFKRITGSIEYQIFDYTAITLGLEIYEQSKYYSNTVQFGVKYNLKKKYKRK